MDNPEYEYFLLGIADKVAELVTVPENRKRFEQHSRDLGKKHAVYLQARKRADKQMPLEPLARFLSVLTYNKNSPDEPPRPKIDEALAYYYFSLATIHDKMHDEGYTTIHNDNSAKQLANTGVWPIIENLCVDRQFIIKTAFDHVKADLAKKPAEGEQKNSGALADKMKLVEQVIDQLKRWEKKYLPDNPQAGKIGLVDIVSDEPVKSLVRWLQWRKYQPEVDEVKTECTKILRWSQTTDVVLSQKDLDDNPFVAHEKRFGLKLTKTLQGILENLKADSTPEKPARKEQNAKTTIAAIVISLIMVFLFVLSVHLIPLAWLKNHPNSYGLQGSIICLITCLVVGFFKPQWRKWWWRGAFIAFLGVLLSLLGGPADSNVN